MRGILVLCLLAASVCAVSLRAQEPTTLKDAAEQGWEKAFDLVNGMLSGMNDGGDVTQLMMCSAKIPTTVNDILNWLDFLKKMDWKQYEQVIQMFGDFFGTMQGLALGLLPCAKVPAEMDKLLQKIVNIDPQKMLTRLLFEIMTIFEWVTDMLIAIKQTPPALNSAGRYIGKILHLALLVEEMKADGDVKEDILAFLKGLLTGLNIHDDFKNIYSCIEGAKDVFLKIKEAIEFISKIKEWNFEAVKKGLEMLFSAVAQFLKVIAPCTKSVKEIGEIVAKILSINILSVLWRIAKNFFSFIQDIKDIFEGFKNRNFERAGKGLGSLLCKLLISGTEDQPPAKAFIEGLFDGLRFTEEYERISECLGDLDALFKMFVDAVELITKWTMEDIKKGIDVIKSAIGIIFAKVDSCVEGWSELKELLEKISHIDVMSIAQKIIDNPLIYIVRALDLINNIKSKNFNEAGRLLGLLLRSLVLESQLQFNLDSLLQLLSGFLEAMNIKHEVEELKECIDKFPEILHEFQAVVELIKQVDWKHLDKLVDALKKLFDAFKKCLDAVRPCMKTPGDIDFIIKRFQHLMEHPEEIMTKVMKNIIAITADLLAVVKHLEDGDYNSAGKDVGDIVYKLVICD